MKLAGTDQVDDEAPDSRDSRHLMNLVIKFDIQSPRGPMKLCE
jgi:hypothetical protein